ncbi:hypothetical protein [Halalkalicoccus sp. NIPERK01]|uniref:hypothetical protein n=1 Tax=Halalkalicoccus sp. NIPERK01 TaxID=3053469 RepID=UPI00256F45F0|nr:hypothetical protein [Halalkalicoccus sp. NIPERK01]MDL5363811.1 hypothetical protein [Halalkalicoccus sp. NIPERK01]
MTTLVAIESPEQADVLTILERDHPPERERTFVVHAPEGSDNGGWTGCRHVCTTIREGWECRSFAVLKRRRTVLSRS